MRKKKMMKMILRTPRAWEMTLELRASSHFHDLPAFSTSEIQVSTAFSMGMSKAQERPSIVLARDLGLRAYNV
jgi:hypothetical protein